METAKQAREIKIYAIDADGVYKTNLFDFVMESGELTTSPRGVEPKLHVRSNKHSVDNYCDEPVYEVWDWGVCGQYPRKVDTFETEEEAEDFVFQRVYQFDFLKDDSRDTQYFEVEEDAEEELIRRYAETEYISFDTAKSVLRHKRIVDTGRIKQSNERKAREVERITRIAEEYAKITDEVPGETYKETAKRLSGLIGERIESKVFHKAVAMIRSK